MRKRIDWKSLLLCPEYFFIVPFPMLVSPADETGLGSLPLLELKIQSDTSLFRSQSKQPQCKDHSKCSTLLHRDIDQHVHLCCCTICSMDLYCKRENKQRKLSLAQMLPYVPRSYGNSPCGAQQCDSVNCLISLRPLYRMSNKGSTSALPFLS